MNCLANELFVSITSDSIKVYSSKVFCYQARVKLEICKLDQVNLKAGSL